MLRINDALYTSRTVFVQDSAFSCYSSKLKELATVSKRNITGDNELQVTKGSNFECKPNNTLVIKYLLIKKLRDNI